MYWQGQLWLYFELYWRGLRLNNNTKIKYIMKNLKTIKTIKVSPIYTIRFKVGKVFEFSNVVVIESGHGNTEVINLDTKDSVMGNVEHKDSIRQDAIKSALESKLDSALSLK